MKQDAQVHADEDKKKKEKIEAKNNAEALVYTAEKTLRDFVGKVKEEDKKDIEGKIEALKKIKDGEDTAAITSATSELSVVLQKVGAEMYKTEQPGGETPPPPNQEGGQEGPKEGPIEGKFEEKQ